MLAMVETMPLEQSLYFAQAYANKSFVYAAKDLCQ